MGENEELQFENLPVQYDELALLTQEQGISVWGTNHQHLENQALQELSIFAQESTNKSDDLEDGELIDKKSEFSRTTLDITSYLKRQEQLKKIQDYRKTVRIEDKNKVIADKIGNKLKRRHKGKEKINKKSKLDEKQVKKPTAKNDTDEYVSYDYSRKAKQKHENTDNNDLRNADDSDSEYIPSNADSDSEIEFRPRKAREKNSNDIDIKSCKDDGCLEDFQKRLKKYYEEIEEERKHVHNDADDDEDANAPDYYTIKGGLRIPLKLWNNLFGYQQDGVRWLWRLHKQNTGGILGDEMGLGKTVQMIAFLAGLEYSQISDGYKGLGPTLIICPITVIHQWVEHFHQWAPEFRVAVLHRSSSFAGNKTALIKDINKNKGILLTNYIGVVTYINILTQYNWHYVVVDEGHKIRNPKAKVSLACKKIRTKHRIMLTGSPMQNNLQELWSLFDFTNPCMLGDLTTFMEHFNNPIIQGGFINATPMQEATALQVATTLKDLITPFLLRRTKMEVQEHINLPDKTEQVLFCSLTDTQRDLYKGYLMSDHVSSLLSSANNSKHWFAENKTRANVFVSIITLRKICNHPDIYLYDADEASQNEEWGFYKKSGKMVVVSALLKIWKKQNHRVLLFTQSRQMISILGLFLKQQGYKYLKMDGSTAVTSRQSLINKFNNDASYDVFLLTTRVGGLGVNLTGADRVIIYDPDWNPAVDTQARERAWRIGQDKQVTIYRLLSAGTIEEKMYQRQVWKQLLGNKVLLDPKTQKFFKSSSLHDLFSLPEDSNPETTNIFRESRVRMQEQIKEKKAKNKKSSQFTEDKIQAMKNLAQQISKSLSTKTRDQIILEEERRKKFKEKKKLKNFTAPQLLQLNREKAKDKNDMTGNSVDDCKTNVSFSRALEYTEKTAVSYHTIKEKTKVTDQTEPIEILTKKRKKNKDIFKSIIDKTGAIEGEKVEGLVKTEIKKLRKKYEKTEPTKMETQDQYVLEKLFSSKGVSGALQHDSVVQSSSKTQSLRVRSEAQQRADKALEALRKSRLTSWSW